MLIHYLHRAIGTKTGSAAKKMLIAELDKYRGGKPIDRDYLELFEEKNFRLSLPRNSACFSLTKGNLCITVQPEKGLTINKDLLDGLKIKIPEQLKESFARLAANKDEPSSVIKFQVCISKDSQLHITECATIKGNFKIRNTFLSGSPLSVPLISKKINLENRGPLLLSPKKKNLNKHFTLYLKSLGVENSLVLAIAELAMDRQKLQEDQWFEKVKKLIAD